MKTRSVEAVLMIKAFEHITIMTGAARRSLRSEVADEVVAQIRTALAADGRLWAGWSVRIVPSPSGTYVYDLLHDGRRIAACWLCLDRNKSESLWDLASRAGALPGTRLHRPAGVPWLAAQLAPDLDASNPTNLVLLATAMSEVGDVERCVAWALID